MDRGSQRPVRTLVAVLGFECRRRGAALTRRNRRRRATKNEVWGFGSRNDEKKRAIAHGAASLEPSARTRSGCWEVVEERDEGKGKGRGRTGGRTKFGMDGKSAAARACRGRWGTRRKGEIWRAQRFFSLSKASSYPHWGVASGPLGLRATGPLDLWGARRRRRGRDGTWQERLCVAGLACDSLGSPAWPIRRPDPASWVDGT